MKPIILQYQYGECESSSSTSKRLFGYRDTTQQGKYVYDRKGELEPFHQKRIGKGVLLVSEKDKEKVMSILEKYNLSVEEIKNI